MDVTSALVLSVRPDSDSATRLKSEDLPAWVGVRSPCPSNAVQFLVYCEVFESKFMFEFMGHSNA